MRAAVLGLGLRLALAVGVSGALLGPSPAGTSEPVVTAVELVSSQEVPREETLAAIGELTGRPRSRDTIRESLVRLWALGLFDEIRVEEQADPPGVRLLYHVTRRPWVRRVTWRGELGLDQADVAAAAGLALREALDARRLLDARRDLLTLYRREGYWVARVEIEVASDPETNARDLTVTVDAGAPARVGEIRVHGTARTTARDLRRDLGVTEGDRYQERRVEERVAALQERLRAQGFFEARVRLTQPVRGADPTRIDFDLEVVEGPRFRVEFQGLERLRARDLEPRLGLVDGGVVDALTLQAAVQQVIQGYREQGHHFVRAEAALDAESDPRVIRFQVTEGPRVMVESVKVTGTTRVSAERLAAEMATRPPGLLRPGLFRQEALERDGKALRAFLRAQGFPDATVSPPEVEFSEDRGRARVTIRVMEGPPLRVGTVAAVGQRALPERRIVEAVPLAAGAPWNAEQAAAGRRSIERLYARQGYHGAAVEVEPTRRGDAVDVLYRVEEGVHTRIGRILIRGLLATQEAVVLRQLPFRPGDPFDPEQLSRGRQQLAELRAFERVMIEPLRPPPAAFADVEVTVRERKPWRLDFGLGYGNDDGGRGFLEIGHDNLFGTGRSASLRQRASLGGERTDFTDRTDLVYREPWVLGTPWHGEVSLFRERRAEIGFDLDRFGLTAGAERDLYPERIRGLRGLLRYRLEHVERSNVDPTLAAADVTADREFVASLTPALVLDRRIDPLDPKGGSLHLVSLELGGLPLGGEIDFVKGRIETAWFLDWLPPTVLAVSARLGLATPLGTTDSLAIEDRFFAGGATSVRGFRENRLGPRDAAGNPTGGNALVVLNLEWRFPIWGWIGGAIFVDAGQVVPEIGDLRPEAFRVGAGGGLRLATPVGPVRLDVGYAVRGIPGEDRLHFYFTLGHPF